MKVQQGKALFRPITITLETRAEAAAFWNIVDKLDSNHCNSNGDVKLIDCEYKLIMDLSNFRTNGDLSI